MNTKKENIKKQSFQFSGKNIDEKGFEFYRNIISPRDIEINNLEYKSALKTDKRTYIQYYISLLKTKHILLFSFFYNDDYNAQAIKKFLFFFIIVINFTGNTLFFNDSTMHKIYLDEGKFNFIYQIPKILLSSLITGIITTIFKMTALSEEKIILLKNEKDLKILEDKIMEMYKAFGIKYVIFFIASFILFFIFWYYVSIFCVVYPNTQLHLIKDFAISYSVSLLYPFGLYLLPGIFRRFSLKAKNRECCFKFSKILQFL